MTVADLANRRQEISSVSLMDRAVSSAVGTGVAQSSGEDSEEMHGASAVAKRHQGGELIDIKSNAAFQASVVDFKDSRRASMMTRCDSESLSKSSCPAW